MGFGLHIVHMGFRTPNLTSITSHVRRGQCDRRIVIGILLYLLYLLIRHCLLQSRGIEQRILCAVTFRHDGHDGKHLTIFMHSLLGLQTHGVVDGLASCYLVGGYVHKANGFTGSNDCSHLFIHSQLLHLLVGAGLITLRTGLLCHHRYGTYRTHHQCAYGLLDIHIRILWMLMFTYSWCLCYLSSIQRCHISVSLYFS